MEIDDGFDPDDHIDTNDPANGFRFGTHAVETSDG